MQGFLDTLRVMNAVEEQDAKQILFDRKVDLILLCPNGPERTLYTSASGQAPWYDKLRDGNVPSWIRTIPIPSDLQASFKLFEVIPKTPIIENTSRLSADPV